MAALWPALAGARARDIRLAFPVRDVADPMAGTSLPLMAAVAAVEHRAGTAPSAETLHELALLRLAQGRCSEAVLALEAAADRAVRDPAPLTDLAAAHLARHDAEGRGIDVVLALAAARRALAIDARLPAALHNQAEALTRLGLNTQAREAWRQTLRSERGSAWSLRAAQRLRQLSAPTAEEAWRLSVHELRAAAARSDSQALQDLVSRFPQFVRVEAEEKILPAWGRAATAGDSAAAAIELSSAREIGAALATATGDAMVADVVARIDDANPTVSADTAAGLAAFGRALELADAAALDRARPHFVEAAGRLRRAGSPFVGWPEYFVAVRDHFSTPHEVERDLQRLLRSRQVVRYPVLAGRAQWLLGTIANNSGRPEEARRHYEAAFALLDQSVGPQLSSFVGVLLGEAYTALGDVDQAWDHRIDALTGVAATGEPRRVHASLMEAASALLHAGHAVPALAVSDELVDHAARWGKPTALAEASLKRGAALDRLGRHSEALVELRRAEEHAAALDPALRDRILGPLALTRAGALTPTQPRRSVEILSAALAADLENGYLYQLAPLLTARARAYRALAEEGRAEDDLRRAIEYHEDVRVGIRDPQHRRSSFGWAQDTFDEMIALQVDRHRRPGLAFDYAERSRSRLLLDLVSGDGRAPGAMPLALTSESIVARLPPGVTLVEYALLPDRLLAWVVARGSLALVTVRVGSADLDGRVGRLRDALARRAAEREVRAAASSLHAVLIAPLTPHLSPGDALVVVPDRALTHVPFAALFDARSGRYLVADRALTVAPSATLFLSGVERARGLPTGERRLLAIGNPAFDRQRHPRLPRLAAAEAEAAEVAALYPGSRLLRGADATRDALLASAGDYRLIHFAGHAELNPTPHLSRLLLAPGTAADGGSVYADELARLPLAATELVVLSACRTVGGARQRENVTGLAAALLAAGSATVVASLWDVEDEPTQQLMRRFHRALRGGADPAAALRVAQLALLASGDPDLTSPAAWAGFEAIGAIVPQRPQP